MPKNEALESCKTPEQIDSFMQTQKDISTTEERCQMLIEHMEIIGIHALGDDSNDPLLLYSLLKESFCDGDWRLMISGR